MDHKELINMLTEGLPDDQAAIVRAAIERDAAKAKVTALKQESEYNEIATRAQALQSELEDQGQPGTQTYKVGAKSYKKWYEENYPKIKKMNEDMAAYQQKYGTLEAPVTQQNPQGGTTYTEADITAMVDKRIQGQYSPRWSDLLVGTGTLVQKHMLAGRKSPIDFKKVAELAEQRYAGNLELAYDEWDKPERDKLDKVAADKEVERRVQEELQKRGASQHYPAPADASPSALSSRTKSEVDKYDPEATKRELANLWVETATEKAA